MHAAAAAVLTPGTRNKPKDVAGSGVTVCVMALQRNVMHAQRSYSPMSSVGTDDRLPLHRIPLHKSNVLGCYPFRFMALWHRRPASQSLPVAQILDPNKHLQRVELFSSWLTRCRKSQRKNVEIYVAVSCSLDTTLKPQYVHID